MLRENQLHYVLPDDCISLLSHISFHLMHHKPALTIHPTPFPGILKKVISLAVDQKRFTQFYRSNPFPAKFVCDQINVKEQLLFKTQPSKDTEWMTKRLDTRRRNDWVLQLG